MIDKAKNLTKNTTRPKLTGIHQMAVSFVAKRPLVIVLSILAAPTVYMLAQQYIPK